MGHREGDVMPALEEGPSTGPSWLIIIAGYSHRAPEGARVIRLPPISGLPHREPGPVGALQGPSPAPRSTDRVVGLDVWGFGRVRLETGIFVAQ